MTLTGDVSRHVMGCDRLPDGPAANDTRERIRDLQDALHREREAVNEFLTQWNAYGPNSDPGRAFQTTRNRIVTLTGRDRA